MNKRAVDISSLVILLALLSFIVEMCLYYFIPQHYITVLAAIFISLGLTHFFLETSLNYDYCFLHAAFMSIASVAFTVVIYLIQPNQWIPYDYSLLVLCFMNWFVPFVYCFIRDFIDRGPRFANYTFFFNGMSIVFLSIYGLAIIKQLFLTPFLPPYRSLNFGAHNFIPFMATGNYLEATLSAHLSTSQMITYLIELILLSIPFGFYARVYFRHFPIYIRIMVYIGVPFILELLQYLTGIGQADIDDFSLCIIGTCIGIAIYHIVYRVSYEVHKRDFLEDRTVVKKLFNYNHTTF